MRKIQISDCTLRDAKSAPGVFLDVEQSVTIAKFLISIGVDEIEAGVVNHSETEKETLQQISKLVPTNIRITAAFFCVNPDDIERSIEFVLKSGCTGIFISMPCSDILIENKSLKSRKEALSILCKAIRYAKAQGLYVAFSGEDSARANEAFLVDYIKAGQDSGANRFRFAESVACLAPHMIRDKISFIRSKIDFDIEMHSHSAYGLAVANTIAGLEAGATWASVTVDGIGERGGNCALAPILLYAKKFNHELGYNLKPLKKLSEYTALCTGLPFHRFTPIVGPSAFEYEVFNQFKSPSSYEDYDPAEVGNARKLILGKRVDINTVKHLCAELDADEAIAHKSIVEHIKKNMKSLTIEEAADLIKSIRS